MPTITVNRDLLFASLGKKYTDDEFSNLCFDYGIELDEVTSEKQMLLKEQGEERAETTTLSDDIVYKIEIPANRYDLLCLEGLSLALRVFLQLQHCPTYHISPPKGDSVTVHVHPSVKNVRPFIVAAILRNVTLNNDSYRSLMDLQEKLHQNLCRRRTLVAIGTHDLDTLQSPIVYEARAPSSISFVALNRSCVNTATELLEIYKSDNKLKKYLPILDNQPLIPVVRDARGTVASMPPIINSEHSKIKLSTRNILVECTATDLTKANTVLNTILTMFSQYSNPVFSAESVTVTYENGPSYVYPNFKEEVIDVPVSYLQSRLGLDHQLLPASRVCDLLSRMCLPAKETPSHQQSVIHVRIPPTRSDILHACDIVEDVAIAYGYNKLPISVPPTSTVARQFPLNKLSDHLRTELAMAGYTEALTLSLCSHADNFKKLGREDSGNEAVVLANPKSVDCEIVRTNLLAGLLKTLACNKKMPLPMRLFEVSDVVLLDAKKDVGARNERRACVVYYGGATSGFEMIHGMVDRIMQVLNVSPIDETVSIKENGLVASRTLQTGYKIEPLEDSQGLYFSGRCASIIVDDRRIGAFGILHPNVLKEFDLVYPCSALEINIETFL